MLLLYLGKEQTQMKHHHRISPFSKIYIDGINLLDVEVIGTDFSEENYNDLTNVDTNNDLNPQFNYRWR